MVRVAAETATGTSVLDIGAGDAPYRELFGHTRYVTTDWGQSMHPGVRSVDVVAPAHALPIEDGSFGLVLCTQVLEHVPEPSAVLGECFRVLEPGGRLALTVFVDVADALSALHKAGFVEAMVLPRSDGFTAVAQLLRNLAWTMGDADDGLTDQRAEARELLQRIAAEIAWLAPLDTRQIMPLGYTALARKP